MEFEFVELPSKEQINELANHFNQYVNSVLPGLPPESEDTIILYRVHNNQGEYVAGLLANCYWNGLEIDTLWVFEPLRGNGIGSKLVKQAEQFAIENGAVISFLKTVNAKKFYEKLGYEVYGILEDRPIGTLLYHMKKRLQVVSR